ncbi:hypothetical protein B6C83_04600 [Aerococcus urinae]|nr:hypothetical protein B6C83_04600 [Aerococcus urinae]RAV68314.1 flavodoxin [Aerococcus urinae]
MALKICIVYSSLRGNTEAAAFILASFLEDLGLRAQLVGADAYDYEALLDVDGLAIGSYTYGNHAEIPEELLDLYEDLPDLIQANPKLKQALAVFGSGDRDYPIYAKAVDDFAEMIEKSGGHLLAPGVKIDGYPDYDEEVQGLAAIAQAFLQIERGNKR